MHKNRFIGNPRLLSVCFILNKPLIQAFSSKNFQSKNRSARVLKVLCQKPCTSIIKISLKHKLDIRFILFQQTLNNVNPSESKFSSLGISPSFGFFTKQNQLTGILLSYHYTSSSAYSNPEIKNNSYGIGIFRQYWNSLSSKFYFNIQAQLSASYLTGSTTNSSPSTTKGEQKGYNTYFSIDPGFAYRVKKKLILDLYYSNFLRTGYSYFKEDAISSSTVTNTYKNNSFIFDTGLRNFSMDNFRFGFRYLL